MASIKVKFRPSTVSGCEGAVYYQIIHRRRVRQIASTCRLFAGEWDARCGAPVAVASADRSAHVRSARRRIDRETALLARIVRNLDESGRDYTADTVCARYAEIAARSRLFRFMDEIIATLRRNGRTRTSETYQAARRSFGKFRRDEDIAIWDIDCDLIEAYEAWMRAAGLTSNTVSFYNRILRAVYSRAVEAGLTDDRQPFRRAYTGIDKTLKRALPLAAVSRIMNLDLPVGSPLGFARDMFLLSFMFRGMSFIDMAFLRKSDLRNGFVTYRRRKTGRLLTIAWTADMQRIINRYPPNPTEHLLPIIRDSRTNPRTAYRNAACMINRHLKTIARMADISMPLTLYVARHSWATAANTVGVPVSVISEGMGHQSETTTRIYLASLDTSIIDNANQLIINSLTNPSASRRKKMAKVFGKSGKNR